MAILSGEEVTLHYRPPQSGSSSTIPLTETHWLREEEGRLRPATREEMLRALSDIKVRGRRRGESSQVIVIRLFTSGPVPGRG